jgi:hypothetical protein
MGAEGKGRTVWGTLWERKGTRETQEGNGIEVNRNFGEQGLWASG